jgi:hypothetical protein
MPLDEFITEVMNILKTQPTVIEICVEEVYSLRFAAEGGGKSTSRSYNLQRFTAAIVVAAKAWHSEHTFDQLAAFHCESRIRPYEGVLVTVLWQ